MYKFLQIQKVESVTLHEGYPKALFLIDTTAWCREGRYSISWISPLFLDSYLIMLSVKQDGIKYHFLNLWNDSTWD